MLDTIDPGMLEGETVPFVLPQYINHEFLHDEKNMVKLKGRHVLKNIIDTDQPIDTILSLQDGQIGAHRIVLVAVSEFMEDLLIEQEEFRTITLILPDITKKTMETLLSIAYTGKLIYSESEEDEVLSAIEALRFCEDVELTRQRVLNPKPKRCSADKTRENALKDSGMVQVQALEVRGEFEENALKKVNSNPSEPNRCKFCYRTFKSPTILAKHLTRTHPLSQTLARPEEIKRITYCSTCDTQYNTLIEIKQCLERHKVGRCWICLDEVSKVHMKLHYETKHVITREGVASAQCRWCPKSLNLSKGPGPLLIHCNAAHFANLVAPNISIRQLTRIPKPSKRIREESSPSRNSCTKRICLARAQSHSSPYPPFFKGFCKETGKIKIDMDLLPRLQVGMEKLSPAEFAYYTAKRESQILVKKGYYKSEELFMNKKSDGVEKENSSETNLCCESKLISMSEHMMKEFCNLYANLCLKTDELKKHSESKLDSNSNNVLELEETSAV